MFSMLPWIMTLLLLPLFLASSVQAFNTVHTDCTLPPEHTNFVTAPNTRGTLQILWSSLFTILACTWTVLHLNVPKYRPKPEIKEFKHWLGWMVKKYQHPTKWFLLTVLAPEVPFAKYWDDQVRAHSLFHHYEDFFVKNNWTRTHVLFANMGGFALRYTANDEEDKSGSDKEEASTKNQDSNPPGTGSSVEDETSPQEASSTLKQSTSVFSNEKATQEPQPTLNENPAKKFEGVYYLTATDAFKLLCSTETSIPDLADVSVEEINDRSKTDVFMRLLAVGQILWVVVQILSRAVYGLAVTQLEVTVVAFAVCAVGMYLVNQGKPNGVNLPIVFEYPGSRAKLENELETASLPGHEKNHTHWKFYRCKYCPRKDGKIQYWHNLNTTPSKARKTNESHRSQNEEELDASGESTDVLTDMSMFIGSMIFGCIHLIAWHFQFPTTIEKHLWWAAGLWCTFCVVACTLLFFAIFGFMVAEEALTIWLEGDDPSPPNDTKTNEPSPVVDTSTSLETKLDVGPAPSSKDTPKPIPSDLNGDPERQSSPPSRRKSIREVAIRLVRSLVSALYVFVAILLLPFTVAYIVARLFIIVEMFRTLAFLPPDAYVATWSSEIPNIG
ncbi:hypothetical protein M752DRAFT_253414 [Aspergillus phoenicis ATCC 13157]|uniref:Uncharacterized protein n=1 Tax=Aspergillus phoenicis ATCC 13157 TaxID=1353007 RepID=A0A370PGB4_ASPPH|nr:hypothetical protein M752DRAFT_253414 [Aspergillus phoenicis ATCC 13157]